MFILCLFLSLSLSLRQVKQSHELAKEEEKPFEHKDYSLKQGQKIHVSLGVSPFIFWLRSDFKILCCLRFDNHSAT